MAVVDEADLPAYVDFNRDWEDKPLREIDGFYFFSKRKGEGKTSIIDVSIYHFVFFSYIFVDLPQFTFAFMTASLSCDECRPCPLPLLKIADETCFIY